MSKRRAVTVGRPALGPGAVDSFAGIVDGARGTLVFGSVAALHVDVERAGEDYLMCALVKANGSHSETLVAVPVGSVMYFRYDEED